MGEEDPRPADESLSPRQVVLDRLDGETRSAVIEATRSAYTDQDDIWVIVLMVMAAIDQRNDVAARAIEQAMDRIDGDASALSQAHAALREDLRGFTGQIEAISAEMRQAVAAELDEKRLGVDTAVEAAVRTSVPRHLGNVVAQTLPQYTHLLSGANLGKSLAVVCGALLIGAFLGGAAVLAIAGLGASGAFG